MWDAQDCFQIAIGNFPANKHDHVDSAVTQNDCTHCMDINVSKQINLLSHIV